jgi:hypothetical protein
MLMLFDSRTTDDQQWQYVVAELQSIAPVVLVDARDTTPGVVYEVHRTLTKLYTDKTLFLCNADGSCPAIALAMCDIPLSVMGVQLVLEKDAFSTIRTILGYVVKYGAPHSTFGDA